MEYYLRIKLDDEGELVQRAKAEAAVNPYKLTDEWALIQAVGESLDITLAENVFIHHDIGKDITEFEVFVEDGDGHVGVTLERIYSARDRDD